MRYGLLLVVYGLLNIGLLWDIHFGENQFLRYVQLPNASCRYIANAPTYCYFYSLQEGLTNGYTDFYIDLYILLLITGIGILVLGRAWCAWLCPLGFAGELIMKLRELLRIPYKQLDYRIVAFLDHFKYGFLFMIILVAVIIGIPQLNLVQYQTDLYLPFCQICPAKGLFSILQILYVPAVRGDNQPALAISSLAIFLIGSFGIRMFFCRICPMGTVMAFMNRFSLLWLRKNPDRCTKCRICLRVCPMDFAEVFEEMDRENITGGECTICGRCVEKCPEPGALSIMFLRWKLWTSKRPR